MCGLCLDACDAVMDKIGKPKGLIKYASWDGIRGKEEKPLFKRPRVWLYTTIMTIALAGIIYGLSGMESIELKVIHARQPLFVLQSDGTIQNRYTLKVLNKLPADMDVKVSVKENNLKGLIISGAEKPVTAHHGTVTPVTIFVRVPKKNLTEQSVPLTFVVDGKDESGQVYHSERESVFIGPK